jgi:hypothetical protein
VAENALRWKHGIFGLMELWGLEPEDVIDDHRLAVSYVEGRRWLLHNGLLTGYVLH